jgi:hypothetical protein
MLGKNRSKDTRKHVLPHKKLQIQPVIEFPRKIYEIKIKRIYFLRQLDLEEIIFKVSYVS